MATRPPARAAWLLVGLWAAVILLFSVTAPLPGTGIIPDKVVHVAAYALLAFLLRRGLLASPVAAPAVVAVLAAVAYGALVEGSQSILPGRRGGGGGRGAAPPRTSAPRRVPQAAGAKEEGAARRLGREGDLGTVAEALRANRARTRPVLTVDQVHEALDRAAPAAGSRAQTTRLAAIATLLKRAAPLEARYLVRTVTGKLRLGAGDMTVLDALAEVYGGGRAGRHDVERAYNLTSDLGFVAERIARGGLAALRKISVVVGKPIRPMLAERLGDPHEILQKLGGRCIAESKYDGERLQT